MRTVAPGVQPQRPQFEAMSVPEPAPRSAPVRRAAIPRSSPRGLPDAGTAGEVAGNAAEATQLLSQLRQTPGYAALARAESRSLDLLLAGAHNAMSQHARGLTRKAIDAPEWPKLSAQGQGSLLRLLGSPESLPQQAKSFIPDAAFEPDARGQAAVRRALNRKPAPIKDYAFRGTKADALCYIGPSDVPVIVPKNGCDDPDEHLPTLEQVFTAIAIVPAELRPYIKRVVVNPVRNPDDEYWTKNRTGYLKSPYDRLVDKVGEQKLDEPERERVTELAAQVLGRKKTPPSKKTREFRSVATGNAKLGTVTYYPRPKSDTSYFVEGMRATMIHEVGHLWAKEVDDDDWTARIEKERLRPSRYGSTSIAEDQAELMVLYIGSRGQKTHSEFNEMFPRMKLIDETLSKPRA